ncbi:MAG: hypothetical protein ABIR06_09675 [Cyclobacteriaceae bacterium]
MENYRIYCEENERPEVMAILRKYNDIVIDNVDSTGFGITIERDNAESFFNELLAEIEQVIYINRQAPKGIVSDL